MNLKRNFIAIAIVGALVFGGVGASTAFASSSDLKPETTEVQANHSDNNYEPEAIPAVVGLAVGLPAAAAGGKAAAEKVGEWVADKLIGIWSVDEEKVAKDADLDVIFD